ncbi:MAG: zinc metallopeptidase [Eubacteriales bacterium]|nr:zinc metallopeptidase [Eubacteriales bacterium]
MWYYDWTMILLVPGLLLGLWAQFRVKSAYAKYSRVHASSGLTADEAARRMLRDSGNGGVALASVKGELTDHYDPKSNTLRLSEGVYGSTSVAAIGIAAHECGHAMQQGSGYAPLKLRSAIVPVVNIGSNLYFPLFLLGIVFSWEPLVTVGICCFALTLVFSLVTLPVEFNASKRALQTLSAGNYLTADEMDGARAVLNAAAMTYVAAAISSLLQLLRLVILSRRNSRD